MSVFLRALEMTDAEACDVITWTDEPELIAVFPGDPGPDFTAEQIAAARLRAIWNEPTPAEQAAVIAACAAAGVEYPSGRQVQS